VSTQRVAIPSAMGLLRSGEVLLAAGVMGILLVMVFPLPKPLLDLLLAFNITISVLIMMVALYIVQPLEFSVFPTMLLVATLFRLSLNVASTRLILLHGHEGPDAAGHVIRAFGSFVVGGNYVVGMVVFLILVVINFIVITKGSGRIAEVAARFTLDAMPGKQMSIDADLNAGLIDDRTARERRKLIEREADFYGAMDGASKFVRGDAIAGMVIVFINIVGGLLIGVGQKGMPILEGLRTYTILTIGDGLVSQIPALVVSTAAGLVVTRAASDSFLGTDLLRQVVHNFRAVAMASAILLGLGLLPGLPALPFMALACGAGVLAWRIHSTEKKRQEEQKAQASGAAQPSLSSREEVEALLPMDPLELEIGYALIPLVDSEQKGTVLERIRMIRRQVALEMGVVIPLMHIRDNLHLKPNQYSIKLNGVQVASGELMMGHCLALDAGSVKTPIKGIPTQEPTFGLPALWIPQSEKDRAQALGYTVVDPDTVLVTHLSEVVRSHLHELLSRQDVQRLLENVAKEHPKVVEELVPKLLSIGEVHRVLQNLLRERVSVRNLVQILESLGDWAPHTRNPRILAEHVRCSLGRAITRKHLDENRCLPALLLDPALEEMLLGSMRRNELDSFLALDPETARRVILAIQRALEPHVHNPHPPVLLCDAALRPHLKQLTERYIPTLTVMSHQEVDPEVTIQALDNVRLSHES
jgi:flagellar biosynthesis protein FlhA